MHVARLFDREVALVDGAVALRAEAHFLFEREAREDVVDAALRFVVERGIDAVAVENREADLAQRIAEVLHERRRAHVARADDEVVVELLVLRRLREVIALLLGDAFVAAEVLVAGADAVVLAHECGT